MGKKIIMPAVTGYGATVLVTLVVQLIMAQAGCKVVTPAFSARFANETAAILAQLGLVGCIGAAFAAAAQIFEIARWSYLLQGAVHFVLTAAVWMPIAWLCWYPAPGAAVWLAVIGWALTYGVNWLVQYLIWRSRVRQLNRSIRDHREAEHECD